MEIQVRLLQRMPPNKLVLRNSPAKNLLAGIQIKVSVYGLGLA